MAGCFTLFFRLLTEAVLVRLVARLADGIFNGSVVAGLRRTVTSILQRVGK
jgi:hypothetical protein